jgi:hypothetical protein
MLSSDEQGKTASLLPKAEPAEKTTTVCGPLVRVEQKNNSTVRKTAGHFRYSGEVDVEALRALY